MVGAGKGAYLYCESPVEFTQSLIASEFFIGSLFSFPFTIVQLTEFLVPQFWAI